MSKQTGQQELFEADATWFHVFKELIKSKTWARMSAPAKALYPTIKSFTNWKTGSSFPSVETMEEYSGLSRPSIFKALKELEDLGYVRGEKRAGRPTVYTLVEKIEIQDSEGRPVASASFDYLPSIINDTMVELRNYVAKGMTDDGKLQFIHVDRFIVENLNVISGDHNTVTGSMIGSQNIAGYDLKRMMKGVEDKLEGKVTDDSQYADEIGALFGQPDKNIKG
jgi:DNA-binding GntR family transcriptional regulator